MVYLPTFTIQNQPKVDEYASPMDGMGNVFQKETRRAFLLHLLLGQVLALWLAPPGKIKSDADQILDIYRYVTYAYK